MFTASGLLVRFLKVFEKGNYQSVKWVRYLTKAQGSYQVRVRRRPLLPSSPSGFPSVVQETDAHRCPLTGSSERSRRRLPLPCSPLAPTSRTNARPPVHAPRNDPPSTLRLLRLYSPLRPPLALPPLSYAAPLCPAYRSLRVLKGSGDPPLVADLEPELS